MSDHAAEDLREVGRIGRAHGVRGDVYVELMTDRVERLGSGARLRAGSSRWLTVSSARQSAQRWLAHFDGIDDRNAAEALTGTKLYAEPFDEAPGGGEDELWVHDLIGARVVDIDGMDCGTCVSVLANPASDLLELASGALVPVRFVVQCARGVITIDPPEGLLDA